MNKSELKEAIENGAEILVNHDRCSVNGNTVRRKFVDDLFDDDKLVFVGKPNNFTKAYKLAEANNGTN